MGRSWRIPTGAAIALAIAGPLYAQGNSGHHGNGKNSKPPNSSPLPSPTTGPASGASPIAWLDDASVITSGSMALTVGGARWSGADLSEVDVPVVSASIGLSPRFQLGANVPCVVSGADGAGLAGVGTSYVTGKIAVLTGGSGVKVALSPMLEILSQSAAQALSAGQSRARFGLPASIELEQGPARVFASTGFFTRGAWFAGGGVGLQATPTIGLSLSFTRSWATDAPTGVTIDRRELGGGLSYFIRPQIAVYGSIAQTIGTTDENGAGRTVGGGITFLLSPGTPFR